MHYIAKVVKVIDPYTVVIKKELNTEVAVGAKFTVNWSRRYDC